MSVPPVPVPGGDEDHLFEKITLQHSWYLSRCFLWNPREWPPITVGRSSNYLQGPNGSSLQELVPSPVSSKQCAVCALQGCSYLLPPLPEAGENVSSFPHVQQQPGMQGRARGLLLARGEPSASIITSSGGRWRQTFLAHRFAACCIGKGMAPGCGSGKRLLRGQHPGEPEGRKRGPAAVVALSTPKLSSSWARQEGAACGREQETVRGFHVRIHGGCSCSHLTSSPFPASPAAR